LTNTDRFYLSSAFHICTYSPYLSATLFFHHSMLCSYFQNPARAPGDIACQMACCAWGQQKQCHLPIFDRYWQILLYSFTVHCKKCKRATFGMLRGCNHLCTQ